MKKQGHFGESERHSLQARGIGTSPIYFSSSGVKDIFIPMPTTQVKEGNDDNFPVYRVDEVHIGDFRNEKGEGNLTIYVFPEGHPYFTRGDIHVYITASYGSKTPHAKVNWSALGSEEPEHSRKYAEGIIIASRIADNINEQIKKGIYK
jgi:hypothetical protein